VRALVVDDSRATGAAIERLLRELNFTVSRALDGRQALVRLAEQGAVDVMLVDWNMPEMNGYELLCAVRADPRWQGIPVMMVTSEVEIDGVRRALEAGANEYLMKPFTGEALHDKLALLGLVEA